MTIDAFKQNIEMTTALLLIDIQNDYFENGSNVLFGSLDAAKNARRMLDEFRRKQWPVVHIQHLSTRPTATFFIPGTFGSEIHAEVQPLASETVIIKHTPNSFRDTHLLDHLRSLSVERLVVCGMMTHMCVDSTVRAARDFGFECSLVGDACATKDLSVNGLQVSAASVQTAFLSALNYFYATVLSTREALSEISHW